jgi:hypothetical protein
MNQEQVAKLELSIQNMKDKKSRIYFIVQDTKGNARASISYIYRLAMSLLNNGYNAIILHEKPDYTGVGEWLGEEYMTKLPHTAIEGQNLEVAPEDFIVIPELFGYIMSQVTKLPCGKIILSQAYDHILETLQPGETWTQLGFLKVITTSEAQKEFIDNLMKNVSVDILQPYVSESFYKQTLPPKPIVSIHTRDQRDTMNIIKTFYIKYPQYRWITFRDMRNLSEHQFAAGMRDTCLSVWVDETSAYGTYPLESMVTGVPVLGLVPNLVPSWMNEKNGFWINNKLQAVDVIADFIQHWLEDNVNEELYTEMEKTVTELKTKEDFEKEAISLFDGYITTRLTSFEEQLSKLETIEE